MTPAVDHAKKRKVAFELHQYEHDPGAESYGLEAADKLGVAPERVFKTLVVEDERGSLAVAMIPVIHQLNLKQTAKALKTKKVKMADAQVVQRSTGYVLGGVSPIGQKKRLASVLDESAAGFSTIMVSAGRRGLEIELSAADLMNLTQAKLANLSANQS